MTTTHQGRALDLAGLRAKADVDVLAKEMFSERWPGKSWDGCDVSRSYWRRKARARLSGDRK